MKQYRTLLGVLSLAAMLLIGLLLMLAAPAILAPAAPALFAAYAGALVALGGILAGKSAVQHLADGSGLKGAVSTLVTSTKPGEPAP